MKTVLGNRSHPTPHFQLEPLTESEAKLQEGLRKDRVKKLAECVMACPAGNRPTHSIHTETVVLWALLSVCWTLKCPLKYVQTPCRPYTAFLVI